MLVFNNGIRDARSSAHITDYYRLPLNGLNASIYTGLNAQKVNLDWISEWYSMGISDNVTVDNGGLHKHRHLVAAGMFFVVVLQGSSAYEGGAVQTRDSGVSQVQ